MRWINDGAFREKVIHKECFLWLREDKTESNENDLTDLKDAPQEERTRCRLVFQKTGADNENKRLFVVGHDRARTRESLEEREGTRLRKSLTVRNALWFSQEPNQRLCALNSGWLEGKDDRHES